jgi:hypothetical protein
MFKEIEEMKQQDIERGIEKIKEAEEKYIELKIILNEKYDGKKFKRIIGWDGKGYNVLVDEYEDYKNKYGYYYKLTIEQLKKDIDAHYKTLQNKVEKKIGKILKIKSLGGYDYRFIGEEESCGVEVILAGGYNIQRLHTRWIITK